MPQVQYERDINANSSKMVEDAIKSAFSHHHFEHPLWQRRHSYTTSVQTQPKRQSEVFSIRPGWESNPPSRGFLVPTRPLSYGSYMQNHNITTLFHCQVVIDNICNIVYNALGSSLDLRCERSSWVGNQWKLTRPRLERMGWSIYCIGGVERLSANSLTARACCRRSFLAIRTLHKWFCVNNCQLLTPLGINLHKVAYASFKRLSPTASHFYGKWKRLTSLGSPRWHMMSFGLRTNYRLFLIRFEPAWAIGALMLVNRLETKEWSIGTFMVFTAACKVCRVDHFFLCKYWHLQLMFV